MKKLMVMLATVAAVVVANAGNIQWGAVGVKALEGVTAGKTFSAYLFIAQADTAEAAKSAATSLLGGVEKSLAENGTMSGYLASRTANTISSSKNGIIVSFATATLSEPSYVSTSVAAFMIVIDADTVASGKNYLVMTSSGEEVIAKTFGTSGNQTFGWGSQLENSGWTAYPIPEPTSALLLLLGVAGLALRRKQA